MKYVGFFIILIVNIILLYPLVQYQIAKPKIIIQKVYAYKNVTPNDESAFGDAIIESDGTIISEKWNGMTLKDFCSKGISIIDTRNDNQPLLICKK